MYFTSEHSCREMFTYFANVDLTTVLARFSLITPVFKAFEAKV